MPRDRDVDFVAVAARMRRNGWELQGNPPRWVRAEPITMPTTNGCTVTRWTTGTTPDDKGFV